MKVVEEELLAAFHLKVGATQCLERMSRNSWIIRNKGAVSEEDSTD